MGLFSRSDKDALGAAAAAFSLIALVVAFGALIAAANNDDGGGGGGGAAGGTPVSLTEFAITPKMLNVAEGASLQVTNNGSAVHNLAVEGTDVTTPDLAAGESATLELADVDPGSYTMFCAIPGHREAGMKGTLNLGAAGEAPAPESGSSGASSEALLAANEEDDLLQKEPVDAFVGQLEDGANTEGVGNEPLEPKVLADGTKEFTLVAAETDWEVEPGKTVKAWTYNGTVPGPTIRVNSGDKLRLVLDNQLPQSTAIHWHGLQVPVEMDGVPWVTQDPVRPGERFVYEFTAKGPATGMYHSHHHGEHQVPDGLMGAIYVDDMPLPSGAGPITQRQTMVLNDAGVIGLSLNGKSFPATAPIIAKPGEWVEITYYNEGLQIHPMHLHGIPQLVYAKDGFPLPQPYLLDTLNVAPGERYSVLVNPQAEQAGVWAYHCHILNHAERDDGMFGMVTTFIVQA